MDRGSSRRSYAFLFVALLAVPVGCVETSHREPTPAHTVVGPLGLDGINADVLQRRLDWELNVTDALLADAQEYDGPLAEWIRSVKSLESARNVSGAHERAAAIEFVELAYQDAYALAAGFASTDREEVVAAWSDQPRALGDEIENLTRTWGVGSDDGNCVNEGVVLARLYVAEAQTQLETNWRAQIADARPLPEPYPDDGDGHRIVLDGLMLGSIARRITTAQFWMNEAENSSSEVLCLANEAKAREYISTVMARAENASSLRGGADDAYIFSLARGYYPYTVNTTLENGWVGAALEAALRADLTAACLSGLHAAYSPDYAPQPAELVHTRWQQASDGPLSLREAAEGLIVGMWLAKHESGGWDDQLLLRGCVEAMIETAAEHRVLRAEMWSPERVPSAAPREA